MSLNNSTCGSNNYTVSKISLFSWNMSRANLEMACTCLFRCYFDIYLFKYSFLCSYLWHNILEAYSTVIFVVLIYSCSIEFTLSPNIFWLIIISTTCHENNVIYFVGHLHFNQTEKITRVGIHKHCPRKNPRINPRPKDCPS